MESCLRLRGQWKTTSEMGMTQVCSWPVVVALPSGAGTNPIGKAFKRFRNGSGDSLAFFWHATTKSGLT